jgi:membrane protein implicated in regulation of membrane protease activity
MMAEALRLAVFVLSLALAGAAFFWLDSFWAYLAPIIVLAAGGVLAEFVFNRIADRTDVKHDLEDRTRNPPS